VAEPRALTFASLLRQLRAESRLTQEELAEAAGVSTRSVSDLERGINRTARKDTALLLAGALGLDEPVRALFVAAGRGKASAADVLAAARRVAVGAFAAAATRSLPRDTGNFTGRGAELTQLLGAIDSMAADGGVVGIHAIGGMAGVGKTAFAVHAAHKLADRFAGGQVFLPLHGHTPGQRPVDPADALASLLLTVGVAAEHIPPGTEPRMALWRDRLAGRQLLLVLDDAASSEQVRPLLPGCGGSVVLVTSRRRLTALEDATAISLDVLPPGEAAGLLVRLAGRPGLSPDDAAVAEIARLCGHLPLAIGMLARQLHHHPAWTAAGRAAELAAAVDRLELMATEDVSVAAAFSLSYAGLTGDQQRLFRRLGLHPGTDVDRYAAAALNGTGLSAARRDLEVLYDQYLLAEPAPGRYRMHDLIRAHARALAGRDDGDGDAEQATARLLDYYQHTAALAESLLAASARPVPAASAIVPAAVPALASGEGALAWARAERANLLACLDHATRTGQHARILALTAGLAPLLRQDGPYAEAIGRHVTAVRAAQQLGDLPGRATALVNLATVRRATGDFAGAQEAAEEAVGICRHVGDRPALAAALTVSGGVRQLAGDYPGAAGDLAEALAICRDLGDRTGQASVLQEVGLLRLATGDLRGAAAVLAEALGIRRNLGDRLGQARVQSALGLAREQTGDIPGAAAALEEALGICRDLGERRSQAVILIELGEIRRLTGDYPAAAAALDEAERICRDLGAVHNLAAALRSLGRLRLATGDHPAAARDLDEALRICQDIGNLGGTAEMLNSAGTLHRARGDLRQAASCHQQALDLARQIGSRWDEAHALAGLGRCARAGGHAGKPEGLLRQALEIFQQIGAREAAEVSAELEALAEGRSGESEQTGRADWVSPRSTSPLGSGDGRNTQEVRSGLPGGRGAPGSGDGQADRAAGPGPGDQRGHPGQLGER
jgi:tetratricopeptide (TPR) repeat protein/transcriptional regulator with XRE-family HTH domain